MVSVVMCILEPVTTTTPQQSYIQTVVFLPVTVRSERMQLPYSICCPATPNHCHGMNLRFRRETKHAKEGKPAKIIAKMNSLCDPGIIESLYEASAAGVKIQLIVRGICCLKVGIPGVSENIEVRSIVGNFLEHSRIFYFFNDGEEELYMGSADWMPRNLDRRVEIIFPVENEDFIPGIR